MQMVKRILYDQRGIQVLEAIGLALIGVILIALIFNATKGGINTTSDKVGNVLNTIGSGSGLPDQLNP